MRPAAVPGSPEQKLSTTKLHDTPLCFDRLPKRRAICDWTRALFSIRA